MLKFAEYINSNIIAIRKILKKFDKKYKLYYGEIKALFIQEKLNQQYSELNHIFEFRALDELISLLENIALNLNDLHSAKKNDLLFNYQTVNNNSGFKEALLIDFACSTNYIAFEDMFGELSNNIVLLDNVANQIKTNIDLWNKHFGIDIFYHEFNDKNSHLNKRKFILNSDKKIESAPMEDPGFSKENQQNISISLYHTFFTCITTPSVSRQIRSIWKNWA